MARSNTGLERCVPNYTLPSFLRHLICQPGTVAASLVTVAFEFATDGRRRNLLREPYFLLMPPLLREGSSTRLLWPEAKNHFGAWQKLYVKLGN